MAGKKLYNTGGIVYSTDSNFTPAEKSEDRMILPVHEQLLSVRVDSKHRGGKMVTIVEGFSGTQSELDHLGKQLKSHCATGGSVKNNEIIIQGDHREKVLLWLNKNGYTKAKKI